jgi:hypothetical protein
MTITTLTFPQFLRALVLARHHSHGWATEFDHLGIDPAGRNETWEEDSTTADGTANSGRAWQRTRREKLERATPDELAALRRVEEAFGAKAEIADKDLETISLIGSMDWPAPMRSGIWSPGLNALGVTEHVTGSGRLSWLIRRDGHTILEVARPGGPLFRVSYLLQVGTHSWHQLEQALEAVAPQAERNTSRGYAAAMQLRERIFYALGEEHGISAGYPDDPETNQEAQVMLTVEEQGRDSISVLRAELAPGGELQVERVSGAGLYYRHVETMVRAIGYLGIQWEPELEVVSRAGVR